MNDPLDELLDTRLREETPYIDDDGFTMQLMQRLPARPSSSFRAQRAIILFLAAVVAAVVAYFASGEALFVRHGLADLVRLSPVMVLALLITVGVVFMVAGLWAALTRMRDPLM